MSEFILHSWYKTSDGFCVQFVRDIADQGMYNVFRHTQENDYRPFYTDIHGRTAYGAYICGQVRHS